MFSSFSDNWQGYIPLFFLDICEVKGCGAAVKIDFKKEISEDILIAYEKKVVFIRWVHHIALSMLWIAHELFLFLEWY